MNPRRRSLLAAGAFLLVVAALTSWQVRKAEVAQVRLDDATRKRVNAQVEVKALRSSLTQLEQQNDRRREPQDAPKPLLASSAKDDSSDQQQTRVKILQAWLSLRNGALYRKLGLSPEEIVKFENLAKGHFLRMQDIVATAQTDNIPFSDPAITKLAKDEEQQFRQQEKELLGQSQFQELRQYERTAAVRTVANEIAGDSYYTDSPLAASQADQLTQILANNSANFKKGGYANPNDLDMEATIAQANGVLSPGQLAALKNARDGMQAGAKLNQLLTALTKNAAPAPGSAAGK